MNVSQKPLELSLFRKQLMYRSAHRGMRELDLILQNFSEQALSVLEPAELEQYGLLLEYSDTLLYGWLLNGDPVPNNIPPVFYKIYASIKSLKKSMN